MGDGPPTKSNRLEQETAEYLASILWRRRRILRYETGVINYQYHSAAAEQLISDMYGAPDKTAVPEPGPGSVVIRQQRAVIPKNDALDNVTRYEAHLHRLFVQTLHEFEALQAKRRGERVNLARISVTTPPRGSAGPQPRIDMLGDMRKDLSA